MNRLLQRLKGPIEKWETTAIIAALSRSKGGFQCQLLRELTVRHTPNTLHCFLQKLTSPEAGIRRAAARGLGVMGQGQAVDKRLRTEPCTSVKLELAKSWIASGGEVQLAHNALKKHAERSFVTHLGERQPALIVSQEYPVLLRTLTASLKTPQLEVSDPIKNPVAIAHQGRPEDRQFLLQQLQTGGRRKEHRSIALLGFHGDPRNLKHLYGLLSEMSVDPGRGFAHRRTAATALGRMGLKEATRALLQALRREPADHEGRPGAGMGIQFPVRTNIIWALGEIQTEHAIPALIDLLDDDAGSPLGGFYCVAMDALLKIGPKAEAPLKKAALGHGKKAINAQGVLNALRESPERQL
jgi:HEAT repeat protein